MEENLFLLSSLFFLMVILYLLDFWKTKPLDHASNSETHARTRYAVAEKIEQELKA